MGGGQQRNATIKAGLAPITVFLAWAAVVRNMRVTDSFEIREANDEQRQRNGLDPKTRRRRGKTLSDLVALNLPLRARRSAGWNAADV
jgi:hypothetical protein